MTRNKTEQQRGAQKFANCQAAYEHWKKNPHMLKDELVVQFKTSHRSLQEYMKANGLGRPDGRVIGKGSPRQLMIKEAYEAAHAKGESVGWAERYAKERGINAEKGDFRYYAMKNDLPYLAEPGKTLQQSPHKQNL